MKRANPLFVLIALVAALSLLAAACGDDDDVGTGDATSAPDQEAGELPPVDDESLPPAAGACLEGTVDCNDTPGDLDGPRLEPGDSDVEPTTGMLADGGLSPEEALSLGPEAGVIAVTGFYLADEGGEFLCGALAESFPPQCGAGALELVDMVPELVGAPLQNASGVTWTDQSITLFGTVDNGVFTVDALTTG